MWEFCITINGHRHCFPIPILVEVFHRPPPTNYPELELAVSVLRLVEFVQPVVRDSRFTKQLSEVANHFIQDVRKGLPQGMELKQEAKT